MKTLERAITLAEEHCGTPFDEARDDLATVVSKVREFDLLWERANSVIVAFELLGKSRSVPEQFVMQRRCEEAMVALKECLAHEWEER